MKGAGWKPSGSKEIGSKGADVTELGGILGAIGSGINPGSLRASFANISAHWKGLLMSGKIEEKLTAGELWGQSLGYSYPMGTACGRSWGLGTREMAGLNNYCQLFVLVTSLNVM